MLPVNKFNSNQLGKPEDAPKPQNRCLEVPQKCLEQQHPSRNHLVLAVDRRAIMGPCASSRMFRTCHYCHRTGHLQQVSRAKKTQGLKCPNIQIISKASTHVGMPSSLTGVTC